jgi:hypothetical protein
VKAAELRVDGLVEHRSSTASRGLTRAPVDVLVRISAE